MTELETVEKECLELLERINIFKNHSGKYDDKGTARASVKRKSLDLTRSLARLRKLYINQWENK